MKSASGGGGAGGSGGGDGGGGLQSTVIRWYLWNTAGTIKWGL